MDWEWEDGPSGRPASGDDVPVVVPPEPAGPRPSVPDDAGHDDTPAAIPSGATPPVGTDTEPGAQPPAAPRRRDLSPDRTAARARHRQQVRRRRVVALAVLAALAVVTVAVAILALRGCGRQAAETAVPTPAALRTPSASAPLRMGAYGESVGGGLLLGLKLLTADREDVKIQRFAKPATGLTRPDYFDWPAFLKKEIDRRVHPFEAVVLMFGGNDAQDVKVDGEQLTFGTAAWKAMYASRVGAVMDMYLRRGVRRIYWVGMPRMGPAGFGKRMQVLNAIYRQEAARRAPRAEYVDAWTLVDAPASTYQAKYRQPDGVHLNGEGGLKAAAAVLAVVAREWHLPAFEQ